LPDCILKKLIENINEYFSQIAFQAPLKSRAENRLGPTAIFRFDLMQVESSVSVQLQKHAAGARKQETTAIHFKISRVGADSM